jgi:two-component system, OmpR family, phosphate regulon sensor histidine kinase PhoR
LPGDHADGRHGRNIIDNALKYGGNPPKVEIWLRSNVKGSIKLAVSDNGCGIPAEKRRKVFQRFVRLGSELTREKPGTGLGLYIVRTLVNRLGGKISVHDCESGEGTLFQIELPGKLRAENSKALPPPSTKVESTDPARSGAE